MNEEKREQRIQITGSAYRRNSDTQVDGIQIEFFIDEDRCNLPSVGDSWFIALTGHDATGNELSDNNIVLHIKKRMFFGLKNVIWYEGRIDVELSNYGEEETTKKRFKRLFDSGAMRLNWDYAADGLDIST